MYFKYYQPYSQFFSNENKLKLKASIFIVLYFLFFSFLFRKETTTSDRERRTDEQINRHTKATRQKDCHKLREILDSLVLFQFLA